MGDDRKLSKSFIYSYSSSISLSSSSSEDLLMKHPHRAMNICCSNVIAKADKNMAKAPTMSNTDGTTCIIRTCAMKATKIWEVLKVAQVDGGIMVKDFIMQINPKIPTLPTPKEMAMSTGEISPICGVKNLSSSSINSQNIDI